MFLSSCTFHATNIEIFVDKSHSPPLNISLFLSAHTTIGYHTHLQAIPTYSILSTSIVVEFREGLNPRVHIVSNLPYSLSATQRNVPTCNLFPIKQTEIIE